MKSVLILIAFTVSIASFGRMEHKESMGKLPPKERLAFTRNCFKKVEFIGCEIKNNQEFRSCLLEIKEQIDQDCRSFFNRLYKI